MDANVKALLDTIAFSEGTAWRGDHGYNVLVGGGMFDGYAEHPHKYVLLARLGIKSSAAGRYQIIYPTWARLKKKLGLPDFSPASQDAAAIELIRQAGALDDVNLGEFDVAVYKCRRIWASLPGAGYGQPEHDLASLEKAYVAAGGCVA